MLVVGPSLPPNPARIIVETLCAESVVLNAMVTVAGTFTVEITYLDDGNAVVATDTVSLGV